MRELYVNLHCISLKQ
uniref:Uncharacterized protein n=1 Tax=Anguilla anguilla TaxID=7936 RepID=A0A0E9TWZ9_ANGAN